VNDIGLSWGSIMLISIAVFIIFGPKKLLEFGKVAGSPLREFKNVARGMIADAR